MLSIWRILLFLCHVIHAVCSSEVLKNDSDVLREMFSGYDSNVRPNSNNGVLNIILDLYVESFGNIKEADMEYTVYGYMRQRWVDRRLAGRFNRSVMLTKAVFDRAWTPDTFCSNARQANLMMSGSDTDISMTIGTNGSVFVTKRVKIVASCEMNLHDFPLDRQTCVLKFASYGYQMSDVLYRWENNNVEIERKTVAQFQCKESQIAEGIVHYSIGDYSQLTVSFTFYRSVGYYIMQVYIPDILVVAISWTLFWMDKLDMNTRMAVGITTILTIVFLLGSANASLPRVGYAKAIDWYLMVSFAFIFAALLECMLVFQFRDDAKKDKTKNKPSDENERFVSGRLIAMLKNRMRRSSHGVDEEGTIEAAARSTSQKSTDFLHADLERDQLKTKDEKKCKQARKVSLSDRIDIISRYLFPISFLVFNIFYWLSYVHGLHILPRHERGI